MRTLHQKLTAENNQGFWGTYAAHIPVAHPHGIKKHVTATWTLVNNSCMELSTLPHHWPIKLLLSPNNGPTVNCSFLCTKLCSDSLSVKYVSLSAIFRPFEDYYS